MLLMNVPPSLHGRTSDGSSPQPWGCPVRHKSLLWLSPPHRSSLSFPPSTSPGTVTALWHCHLRPSSRTSVDPLASTAWVWALNCSQPGPLPSGCASFPATGRPLQAPTLVQIGPVPTGLQSRLTKNKGQLVSNSAIIQS